MILGTATALGPGSRPALANPPEVTTVINHFETSQHFEADPVCGGLGVTEFANVAEHLHVVDQGDMLHVVYREAFSIPEVYDDPTIPDGERQGTHALTFQLVNNGALRASTSRSTTSPALGATRGASHLPDCGSFRVCSGRSEGIGLEVQEVFTGIP